MKWHDLELREVYGKTLCELIEADDRVVCMEADLSKASGTYPEVLARHPENFVNVGVSEANLICVGAGLANEGKVPFCATFSCFAARRVYDQVAISVAYAGNNVKIVGTAPGVTQGPNGGTHMDFTDLAIMRSLPGMHVYSPVDAWELRAVMKHMAAADQPTYMQLVRSRVPKVFDQGYRFDPERAVTLSEGDDVTLVSTGYQTHQAIEAVRLLQDEGLDVHHLHYVSVKPFDGSTLVDSARRTGAVVTAENGTILGGLGSAVCEVLAERHPVPVTRLGVPDRFGEVADETYLFEKHGFGARHIAEACRKLARKS
ncbi:MAG: transketolase family protein [Planctomycetota bacterium]